MNKTVLFFIGNESNKESSLQLNNKELDLYIPSNNVRNVIARENIVKTMYSRWNGFNTFIKFCIKRI